MAGVGKNKARKSRIHNEFDMLYLQTRNTVGMKAATASRSNDTKKEGIVFSRFLLAYVQTMRLFLT